jgi:long-chain fatty acid transport protein
LLACALAALSSGRARANPLDMFGAGARAASMAGANTAAAMDASANYYNPALLALLPRMEIDIGYRLAKPVLQIEGQDLGVDSARGGRIAFGMPGHIGAVHIGMGVSVYLPDQHLIRIRSLRQEQPRFSLYDNRPQRLSLLVTFAARVSDRLSIGGGLGYVTDTKGSVGLDGRVGFPMADDSDLALALDVDVDSIAYPVLGLSYRARPWLRLAASYRGGVQPVTDLAVSITGDIGADNRDPIVADAAIDLRSVSLSHFQPAQLSAGFDALLSPRWRLAGDLSLHRWSAYENPAAQLTTAIDVGQFNEFLDPPQAALLAPSHFHDILIPRIGIELLAQRGAGHDLHLRAGYSYEPTPAPEQVGITNFVDNDKHTTSVGAGLTLREWSSILLEPLSIDASLALATLPSRAHRKLSPVDPVGDYHSAGQVWQFFTTTRIRF